MKRYPSKRPQTKRGIGRVVYNDIDDDDNDDDNNNDDNDIDEDDANVADDGV